MTSPSVPPGVDATSASPADSASPRGSDDATPVEGPPPSSGRRFRSRWAVVALVTLVLGGAVAAAFLVPLPYYLLEPGSVRPAEKRVEISGQQAYETDGEVMFTTVYLNRATAALMVRAWLDDAVEIRSVEEVYPGGDRDASRQQNRERMDLSKLTATQVALGYLGIESDLDGDGARVLGVVESSPAEGLLSVDDVIVGVDGGEVAVPSDIASELADRGPGDTVEVAFERSGDAVREVDVTLGESTSESGRPVLGVQVEPDNPTISSEVDVVVDSGDVSGPSAGLAWTLAIIDRLSPESLTQGRRVAVTGEIFRDGSVGTVGGVEQKVSAVRRAGIDRFIYPAATPEDQQEGMRRIAGDDVELFPVATIDEAIEVLAPGGVRQPG